MNKTVVFYRAEADDGKWNVVKKTAKPNSYGTWFQTDEKTAVLAADLPKWNAEYIAAYLEYLCQKAKAEKGNDAIFDIESLDELSRNSIDLDQLAYCYVKDSIGTGWGIQNAYKLTADFMMDMWLKGASYRFGVLPFDIDRDLVYQTLSDTINKIIDAYGIRD